MTTLTRNSNRNRPSISRLSSPLDRFFRNDLLDFWSGGDSAIDTIPSINITEEQNHYKIEMAAPGMKKDDFNIDIDNNLINISSEKESESANENGNGKKNNNYTFREYNYSSFSRSFSIPDNAETSKITAKYTDGILSLNIPKKSEQLKNKSQKIKVD
jgi:HSP20 family protein